MTHPDASPPQDQQGIAHFALYEGQSEPFPGWLDTVVAVNGLIPEEIRDANDPSVTALIALYDTSRIVDPQNLLVRPIK